MTETLQSVPDFVKANRIKMKCDFADSNSNMDSGDREMDHWKCKLIRTVQSGKRTHTSRLTITFSMGLGHHGKQPEVADVLDCLAFDASAVDNARSFEDWAGDYGYDTDSRKAEKTYRACVASRDKLKRFLGDDLYQTLLYGTERM